MWPDGEDEKQKTSIKGEYLSSLTLLKVGK